MYLKLSGVSETRSVGGMGEGRFVWDWAALGTATLYRMKDSGDLLIRLRNFARKYEVDTSVSNSQ